MTTMQIKFSTFRRIEQNKQFLDEINNELSFKSDL